MEYIGFAERHRREGLREGVEKGLREGVEKGRKEGVEKGRLEGRLEERLHGTLRLAERLAPELVEELRALGDADKAQERLIEYLEQNRS